MSKDTKYNISIGDNNRDIVIGEGITLVKTGNIEVSPGSVLTINVNGRKQVWAGEVIAAAAARPGEILVLIAEFDGDGQSDWKIEERIRKAIQIELNRLESGSIRVVRLRNLVIEDGDEEKARSLAESYGAAILIWGWYDQVGFSPRFTVAPKTALENPTPDLAEMLIDTADRAFRQYMFRDLPAEISYLATFTAAQILYWEHRFDEAQRTFDRVFAKAESGQLSTPGLPLAYFYQGVLLGTRRGDIQGVIRCMKRATELDPTFAHAFYNWADVLYADGQFEEAIDKLSSALKLEPKHLYALRERGMRTFDLGASRKQSAIILRHLNFTHHHKHI